MRFDRLVKMLLEFWEKRTYYWMLPNGNHVSVHFEGHDEYAMEHPQEFNFTPEEIKDIQFASSAYHLALKKGAVRIAASPHGGEIVLSSMEMLRRQGHKIYKFFRENFPEVEKIDAFFDNNKDRSLLNISLQRLRFWG